MLLVIFAGKKRNLTPEEALDLYFSLPDLESASEDDSEEEYCEELPCDLQSENDSESDGVELAVPTVKRKKKPPRVNTSKQKKRRCSSTAGSSAAADASDIGMEGQWETTPVDVVTPTNTEPTFSPKLSLESTALDAFELFFTDEVVNNIVDHTNLYATQEGTRGWIPLAAQKLRAYFGMLVLMSANPMHQVHLYWSSDSLFYVKDITTVMTHKRFQQITNNLHLNDNTQMPKKGSKEYDRCFKVRPLINMINESFRNEYKPSSRLAVDESMILFKGRSSMKQYMPRKPKIKRGYKVRCIADSSTDYLCKFEVYQGKQHEQPNNRTLGEHVVLSLSEGIVTPGDQLFFDNFFSSTTLLLQLHDKCILACGTYRIHRKDLAAELKVNNELDRGEFIWRRKKNVTAYQWRDTKLHIMSNYYDPCKKVEVDRTTPKGHKKAVRCPSAVRDYNLWMGGVDRFDQKRNAYPLDRRSKRSWSRIFYFILDAAILNAYIQHAYRNSFAYLFFRVMLGRQLISGRSFRKGRRSLVYHKRGSENGSIMTGVPKGVRFNGQGHYHYAQKAPTVLDDIAGKMHEAWL